MVGFLRFAMKGFYHVRNTQPTHSLKYQYLLSNFPDYETDALPKAYPCTGFVHIPLDRVSLAASRIPVIVALLQDYQ